MIYLHPLLLGWFYLTETLLIYAAYELALNPEIREAVEKKGT
jgi:hypothetical protein